MRKVWSVTVLVLGFVGCGGGDEAADTEGSGDDTAEDTGPVDGCDWSDIAGSWEVTRGDTYATIEIQASAAYDTQIAVHRVESGEAWCEISLICYPDDDLGHVANNVVIDSDNLGCGAMGWYHLSLDGDQLAVLNSENADGSGMGGTTRYDPM